jgi:hypothetical protein
MNEHQFQVLRNRMEKLEALEKWNSFAIGLIFVLIMCSNILTYLKK